MGRLWVTDCPVCQKRLAQESREADQCKLQVRKLENRCNLLILILAVLTALVGAELLDQALSITDTVKKATTLSEQPQTDNRSYTSQADTNKPIPNRQVFHGDSLFGNLPPLLVNLRVNTHQTQIFTESQTPLYLPEPGSGLLLVAALIANNSGRKR